MSVGLSHESKLDEEGKLFVRWIELTDGLCVEIEDRFHQTWLKPANALALHTWLSRHQKELEQLAKPKRKRSNRA